MKKNNLLLALMLFYIILMFTGCSKDDPPGPTEPDAYPPGHVWPAGDYPSLTAPATINDNVTIGVPIPVYTAKNKQGFKPTLNALKTDYWQCRITRSDGGESWYQWTFSNPLWSYDIPEKTYKFTGYIWPWSNSELKKSGQDFWPKNKIKTFTLMSNGYWVTARQNFSVSTSGWSSSHDYTCKIWYDPPSQPDLYISMVRTWVVGKEADDDVTRTEGETDITMRTLTGVQVSNTKSFTETWGMSGTVTIDAISLGLTATFSTTTSQTITLTNIKEKTVVNHYKVPANEQWRYITIYGIEKYIFTDENGNAWTSSNLLFNYLGSVDNNVRTFLMIVKYKAGSDKPYSSEFIDVTTD